MSALAGFEEADSLVEYCEQRIREIQDAEYKAARAKAKKTKLLTGIAATLVVLAIAVGMLVTKVIMPSNHYQEAEALFESGKYEEAIEAFEALNGYKDSNEKIKACKEALLDLAYEDATSLYNAGKYEEAIEAFEALNGYKDSEKTIEEIRNSPQYWRNNVGIGDIITFGSYEQDNNTNNGKEAIEWRILTKRDGKILVVSEKALDCQPYNLTKTDTTWEECSLRTWLDESFFKDAFSSDEQNLIVETTNEPDRIGSWVTHGGQYTQDKVFILSYADAKRYLRENSKTCTGTAYCFSKGVSKGDNGNCKWWLRTVGEYQNTAVYQSEDGIAMAGDYVNSSLAVRPALWINLEP